MTIGFFLLERFSSLAYAACIEPFLVANEIQGEFNYQYVRLGFQPSVVSEEGLTVNVEQGLCIPHGLNGLVICGGVTCQFDPTLISWTKQALNSLEWVAGLAGGGLLLAETGQLINRKVSIPSLGHYAELASSYDLRLSSDLFSNDGNVWTCRSGTASMDMILFMLAKMHSVEFSEKIAQVISGKRLGNSRGVSLADDNKLKAEAPALVEALELMETNLEEPLSSDDIAFHVGISRRQLERLFKKHLNTLPSRYYSHLRLEHARHLLHTTSSSVTEIALCCGYSSGAHFSTAYRAMFGKTPKEERS